MNNWTLDYNGCISLILIPEEGDTLSYSSFYKLSLRRYIAEYANGVFRGKASLTYLDYKKIIELCNQECKKRGVELCVSDALHGYIRQRENYLEIRSRLGVEIKNHDRKFSNQFQIYQSVVNTAMSRPLRIQQMWDSFFMCMMRRSANFSVPGSGKTASVLGMYTFLKQTGEIQRIVVICPKNAFGSWIDEFSLCFGGKDTLRVLNLHDIRYPSVSARKSALKYDAGTANLILVNYESVNSVLDDLIPLVQSNSLLVFDEVHKVKRIGGEYASAALVLAGHAAYLTAMTGTPIPNSYLDIYNLLHILFPEEYDEFFRFSIPMLRSPTSSEIAVINNSLQPFFCRTTKEQLNVPPAEPDILAVCSANENENRLLRLLQMKYRKNKLTLFLRILQMESNPHMLLKKLDLKDFRYLLDDSVSASEIDYADYSAEVQQLIENCPPSTKFYYCVHLAEELARSGKRVIIWCIFLDSIQKLSAALEKKGIPTRRIYGTVPLEERQQILNEFKAGCFQVLLTNPHTLAESVSLHSICHDAIYYEYSYNLVHLLQSKDRIHRLGLPEGQYTQYTYIQMEYCTDNGLWSMEGTVYQRLKEKEQMMAEAIDHHILEVLPTSMEDLEIIFNPLFKNKKLQYNDQ